MDLINFYANKDPKKLPRFFYRTFFSHVKTNNLSFAQALDIFSKSVDNFDHPDFHKFFYNIPDYFKQHFSEIEINKLEMVFNKKSKLQERIKNTIFPHVSDEFSLSSNFFKKCFNSNYPKIFSNDKFFMLGSCFARNFSIYLKRKGHEVEVLNQFEDFNSLGSNAIFLKFANMSNAEIENDVLLYLNNIHDKKHKEKICFEILNSIDNAKKQIKNATKIIFTLGNVIDFYDESNNLLPKFIFMGSSEDVNSRALVAKKMKEFGSVMRISNFSECLNYLNIITSSIRLINQKADIIFSLSPVPIDSIIGIKHKNMISSIETDCISKSILRAVFYEFTTNRDLSAEKIYYLPSYEIVRWISPLLPFPNFGNEDAASRHVSNIVINSICEYFYNEATSS